MGAQNFRETTGAKSMSEAYTNLVAEADDEYGHQEGYSGQINATPGFEDITKEWKNSKLSLDKFIDKKEESIEKHNGAQGICLIEPIGNNNKVKSVVKHSVFKGTRKWELVYTAKVPHGNWESKDYYNKGDAVTAARDYTEKTGESTIVKIKRVLSKDSGINIVAKIDYKKSPKESNGDYIFFGWASC